jgi:transcriptional regulator with GAF, ATPase, and Fis domain
VDSPTLPLSATDQGVDDDDGQGTPGIAVVFSGGEPCARVMAVASGVLEIGRSPGPGQIEDDRISRRHAQIAFEGKRCIVTDLGSQNGTFIDGEPASARVPTPAQRVIRVGNSLILPYADVRPLDRAGVRTVDGFVRGPAMQEILDKVVHAARCGTTLHVHGENGTGKEGIAETFHRASPRAARPLVAVNCAEIPSTLAERVLFGAKRGAYSGAEADAPGYLQAADGGTLFLDEIAELDLQVQAKLLRVLESRELLPLGASKSRKVDFALCSATNKDLRDLVSSGALRQDLYFRVGIPAVVLPALRNRPEEVPPLIAQVLARLPTPRPAHVSLVEQCLLRPWPGNVRELLKEIHAAAQAAPTTASRITARHLSTAAGSAFGSAMPETRLAMGDYAAASSDTGRRRMQRDDSEWRPRIESALRASAGNITATARALGLHRTQLRRLIERYKISVDTAANDDDESEN